MEPSQTALEELESVRQKLVQQLEEAEKLFAAENNGHELLTSQAALKSIDELITKVRNNGSARIAAEPNGGNRLRKLRMATPTGARH